MDIRVADVDMIQLMNKQLTFLLSLTFLFLFSGSVYGGVIDETLDDVFDRKNESTKFIMEL
jgi:4-hydroxybenzoate polyprenyltransferase